MIEAVRTAAPHLRTPPRGDSAGEQVILGEHFETRSEAQRVDALVKMRTLGVPIEALWDNAVARARKRSSNTALLRAQR